MMSKHRNKASTTAGFVLAFLLSVGLAGSVWGQYQGKIEGKVTDAAGQPLDKVQVVITSQRTSARTELTTGKDGRFTQIGLVPGYFQVTLSKQGYVSRTLEAKVSIAEMTKVEATLETGEAAAVAGLSDADKLFATGTKLYAEGKLEEAAAAYENAVKLNQHQWSYYLNLGLADKKLGKSDQAIAAFTKAQELNPSSYGANKELAESLAKAGRMSEAKTYFAKAVELSPDDPDAVYNLGLLQSADGEADAAQASFQKCISLKPDYADAYYQLATIEIGQNKVPEAVAHLEKFLGLAPNHEKAPIARQLLEALKK